MDHEIDSNGNKYWYFNGRLHRIGGPAIEHANGTKEWWSNNLLHRIDGPAIESYYKTKNYVINDFLCDSIEDFFKILGIIIYELS